MNAAPAFAAVDWGTSSFRLWLVSANDDVLAERRSGEGMITAARSGFAAVLDSHLTAVDAAQDLPVVICGMAGSRQGWLEARYIDVPASLDEIAGKAVAVDHPDRRIVILPGLAQREAERADVMRGEETQLLGASGAALSDGEPDGLYCMPGTHSKWVRVADGRVVGFSTFMTGELFAVLTHHSILAHAFGDDDVDAGDGAFAEAVMAGLREPEVLTSRLFSIRGRQLLLSESKPAAKARLSGLLIGAELAGSGCAEQDRAITLIASGKLNALYARAFETIGIGVHWVDADAAVLHGLTMAAASLGMIDKEEHST